jgi:hypothetical protein
VSDIAMHAAVTVLNATMHRGARDWHYDGKQARIMPEAWDEAEYPPIFTAFEAVAVARRLVEIGATRPSWVGKSCY